jgi:tungstate transport system ATP-binding protein
MRDDLAIAGGGRETMLARLDRVTVAAGDVVILDGVTLAIARGAPTALVGPNGSGKTTLLRALMGLVAPDAGAVETNGVVRAIVFQRPVMLRRSAADNVAFALAAAGYDADAVAVDALLARVGLVALGGRPARRLSGGEQQRLAIARALARRPALLLLDEATTSLDPAQTKIVEDLIRDIAASGVKIVFATHDLGQVRRLARDVVLLVRGRIAEQAPADAFFTNPTNEAARQFVAGDLIL